MNAVGALTFPDNPADEENVRGNLYEYLNLPEFNVDVPSHFYAFLDDCDDHEDKGVFIYMGVVNGVRQGKGWSLINVMDGTGTAGFFDEQHTGIEKGKSYVILVANNRVMEFVPVDEIRENKAAFVRFLNLKQLSFAEDEFYVLAWKPRKTKAGANMGTLLVANSSREMRSITVFPSSFAMAHTRLELGKAFKMEFGKTKQGDLTLEEVIK